MKRSDMVRIIEDSIDDSIDYDPEFGQTISAGGILRAIEEAGMLPPNKEGDIVKFKANNGLSGINAMINSHRWEPEDEE